MSIVSIQNLRDRAIEIKTANEAGENTALKVGSFMEDFVDTFNTIPVGDSNQLDTIGNVAVIKSIFTKSNNYTITFETSTEYGSETEPIYELLSVDRTNGRDENKSVVYHSSIIIPAILVPTKPTSPLATYANQAAMLSGQGSQLINNHYYYTGSTSAWLYNGTANGLISDYTEVPEIAGWQTWGIRPSWLFILGDTYTIGRNHINRLTFTFHKFYDDGTTIHKNAVVCNILYIANGNEQTVKPRPSIIKLDFNENDNPVNANSLINTAPFANLFEPVILGTPSESFYETISGTNRALVLGSTTDSSGSRGRMEISVDDYANLILQDQITLITRFALIPSGVGGSYLRRTLFSNYNTTTFRGIAISTGETSGSGFRLQAGNGSSLVTHDFTQNSIIEDGLYVAMACTFSMVNGGVNGATIKCWVKSTQKSIPFTLIGNQSTGSPRYLSNGAKTIMLSRRDSSVSMRPIKMDYLEVIPLVLTDAEIESILNIIDP